MNEGVLGNDSCFSFVVLKKFGGFGWLVML